ncbi:Hypothetical protein PBC10988_34080 [Planctomycetales bacterium 10988]|nr:Hypothetical protein PBC10988_34080 [Planctomycetales bacterium 10988]
MRFSLCLSILLLFGAVGFCPSLRAQAPQEADPFQDWPSPVEVPKSSNLVIRAVGPTPSEQGEIRVLAAQFDSEEVTQAEPARLYGVQPGTTTVEELDNTWPLPASLEDYQDGLERRIYHRDPFESVEILVDEKHVHGVSINLRQPVPSDALAKDLSLSFLEPVAIQGAGEESLGQAFPERGVMFIFDPQSPPKAPMVKQIVLETITPEPFILRAEANAPRNPNQALQDIEFALKLDQNFPRAHFLKGKILAEQGELEQALSALNDAIQRDGQSAEYALFRADLWEQKGNYPQAVVDLQSALTLDTEDQEVLALVNSRLGNLLAEGPSHDFHKAIEYHQQAILIAKKLVEHETPELRKVGFEVLLDAHLGVSKDIAWGKWKSKPQVVPKWIERAENLLKAVPEGTPAYDNFQFQVATAAIHAYVGMQAPFGERNWPEILTESGEKRMLHSKSRSEKSDIQWQMGSSLHEAMQVFLANEDFEQALKWGDRAVLLLEQELAAHKEEAGADYQLGRLYFRIGSIHLIKYQDYDRAISWFEKSIPKINQQVPENALADAGRQGESFVTMAIAYWKKGEREKAITLTTQGLKKMEQAVEEGYLPQSALAVPYKNLAGMHRFVGNQPEAQTFQQLSERLNANPVR